MTCIPFKSALRMCEAFMASPVGVNPSKARPFVYVSAEDIFRPVIPARYIETKREAERAIEQMMSLNSQFRGVYIRPSVFIRLMTWSFFSFFLLTCESRYRIPCLLSTSDNSCCSALRLVGSYP
jgi:hypothetical protein